MKKQKIASAGEAVGKLTHLCTVLCLFEMGACHVAQTGLELLVLLLQPPEYWDYRCTPPYPALCTVDKKLKWYSFWEEQSESC
jgi:hypothetical protein